MDKIYYNEFFHKPFENVVVASYQDRLVYLGINKNKPDMLAKYNFQKDISSNKPVIEQLKEYFTGKRKVFEIETEFLIGTEFQKKVWLELAKIPYGKVITYKELAKNTGNSNSSRAVGNANSKNPMPVIFPCHRVIKSDGNLGGFSCGVEVKECLLYIESAKLL